MAINFLMLQKSMNAFFIVNIIFILYMIWRMQRRQKKTYDKLMSLIHQLNYQNYQMAQAQIEHFINKSDITPQEREKLFKAQIIVQKFLDNYEVTEGNS